MEITAVQTKRVNEDVVYIQVDQFGVLLTEGFYNHATNQCFDFKIIKGRITKNDMYDIETDIERDRLIIF
tara:strand:- start:2612 stop:2821 length:210 start_codon:yes stop_codon:yes gene_type:complete